MVYDDEECSKAYVNGYEAYKNGLTLNNNPYKCKEKMEKLFNGLWSNGWKDAKEDIKEMDKKCLFPS